MRYVTLLLLGTLIAAAQSDRGRLVGTVADVTGAVVANASIAIRDTGTGQERTAQSDGKGMYIVNNLPPANYIVKA